MFIYEASNTLHLYVLKTLKLTLPNFGQCENIQERLISVSKVFPGRWREPRRSSDGSVGSAGPWAVSPGPARAVLQPMPSFLSAPRCREHSFTGELWTLEPWDSNTGAHEVRPTAVGSFVGEGSPHRHSTYHLSLCSGLWGAPQITGHHRPQSRTQGLGDLEGPFGC